MKLETQYQNWLVDNPNEKITFIEWVKNFSQIKNLPEDCVSHVSDDFQIVSDGEHEYNYDEMSDWDVTLMDGLEEE
jgi:hypothetical protein